jgi:hypothetical protein
MRRKQNSSGSHEGDGSVVGFCVHIRRTGKGMFHMVLFRLLSDGIMLWSAGMYF